MARSTQYTYHQPSKPYGFRDIARTRFLKVTTTRSYDNNFAYDAPTTWNELTDNI